MKTEARETNDRDFDANPYSPDERRVAEFLFEAGAGGGDDPIGFILASHRLMADQRNGYRKALERIAKSNGAGGNAAQIARDALTDAP